MTTLPQFSTITPLNSEQLWLILGLVANKFPNLDSAILSFATTLRRHLRNQPSSGLCKKHLDQRHVILNAVKDLVPAMSVVLECKDEILQLRFRMTCFSKHLCFLEAKLRISLCGREFFTPLRSGQNDASVADASKIDASATYIAEVVL